MKWLCQHFWAVLLPLLPLLWVCFYYHYPLPLWQHLDALFAYDAVKEGLYSWQDFFTPYQGQWIASGLALRLLLIESSSWSVLLEAAASIVLAALTLRAVWLMVKPIAPPVALWLMAAIVFSLDQTTSWLWGYQLQLYLAVCSGVWCIYYVTQHRPTKKDMLLAISLALIASTSHYIGLALWILGYVTLSTRYRKKQRRLWLLVGVITCYYFYHQVILQSEFGEDYRSLLLTFKHFFGQWGTTLYYPHYWLAIALGVFMVCAVVAFLISVWNKENYRQVKTVLWFVLLGSIIHSIGMIGVQQDQVTLTRLLPLINFAWIITIPLLHRKWGFVLVLGLLMVKLISGYHMVQHQKWLHAGFEQLYHHMQGAYPTLDEGVLTTIHHSQEADVGRHATWLLHKHKLNLYRE